MSVVPHNPYNNEELKNKIEALREEQGQKTPIDFVEKNKPSQKIIVMQLTEQVKNLQKENSELREQMAVIYGKMVEKEAK